MIKVLIHVVMMIIKMLITCFLSRLRTGIDTQERCIFILTPKIYFGFMGAFIMLIKVLLILWLPLALSQVDNTQALVFKNHAFLLG